MVILILANINFFRIPNRNSKTISTFSRFRKSRNTRKSFLPRIQRFRITKTNYTHTFFRFIRRTSSADVSREIPRETCDYWFVNGFATDDMAHFPTTYSDLISSRAHTHTLLCMRVIHFQYSEWVYFFISRAFRFGFGDVFPVSTNCASENSYGNSEVYVDAWRLNVSVIAKTEV